MLVMALLFTVALSLNQAPDSGYRLARVQLSGPLQAVTFSVGDAGETHVVGELAEGEVRELIVPFPAARTRTLPTARVLGAGAADAREWIVMEDSLVLPRGLANRTRPPIAGGRVRPPLSAVLLLVAAGVLAASLRRRPALALVVGTLVGLGAGALALRARSEGPLIVRVLEGEAASGRWLSVETARDWQQVGATLPERVETSPPGRPLRWTVELRSGGEPRYRLESRGSRISLLRAVPTLQQSLVPESNEFVELAQVWTRTPAGEWSSHGAWNRGSALPVASEEGSAPPGWLASGLPQGVPVLLGRTAGREGPDVPTWVRLTGF